MPGCTSPLLAGILGAADLQRITMDLRPGEVVWVGTDQRGQLRELPVALQLYSFNMEEFNPKMTVVTPSDSRPNGRWHRNADVPKSRKVHGEPSPDWTSKCWNIIRWLWRLMVDTSR